MAEKIRLLRPATGPGRTMSGARGSDRDALMQAGSGSPWPHPPAWLHYGRMDLSGWLPAFGSASPTEADRKGSLSWSRSKREDTELPIGKATVVATKDKSHKRGSFSSTSSGWPKGESEAPGARAFANKGGKILKGSHLGLSLPMAGEMEDISQEGSGRKEVQLESVPPITAHLGRTSRMDTWGILLGIKRDKAPPALRKDGQARRSRGFLLTMLLINLSPPLKVTASMEAHSSA